MFEKLIYPNIKAVDTKITDDVRWKILEAERNAIAPGDKKAMTDNVKKQQALADEYNNRANANYKLYKGLWKNVVETIEEDPEILEYKKEHGDVSFSKCLDALANHFKQENAAALAAQIENMKLAYECAKKIADGKDAPELKTLNGYVTNLNKINDEKESLLDAAYAYNEANQYGKVQEGPEALLAIRLGQLAQQMQVQTVAIENAGELYNQEEDNVSMIDNDKYDNIIKNFDVKQFGEKYKDLDATIEKHEKILQEIDALKKKSAEGKYEEIYAEFKEQIDAIIDEKVLPEIDAALKKAKAAAEKDAFAYGENLNNNRVKALEEYDIAYRTYQTKLEYDRDIQEQLDAAEAEMKPALETYNAMLKAAEEKNADFEKQARAEHDQQKQTYAEQTKKISELESKMTKLTEDFERLHVALTNLHIDPDSLAEYNYKFIEFNTLDKMMKYVSNLLPGTNLNDRNAAFDLALGKHEIRDEDFINLTGEEQKLLFNARVIQEGLKNLRTSDKDSDKDLFKRFDDIKKACVLSEKDSPSAMLGTQFQNLSYYINDFNRDHQAYFRAQNTIKTIRDNYNQSEPKQEDIDKLTSEITSLKEKLVVPASDKQFEENLEAKKNENLAEVKSFKAQKIDPLSQKIEELKKEFTHPVEPKMPNTLSQEAIMDDVRTLFKQNYNEAEIKQTIRDNYLKEKLSKCVALHLNKLGIEHQNSSKIVDEYKNVKNTVESMFEFDKLKALKKDDTISQLNYKLEAFEISKQQSYGYIAKAAKSLLDNMDKGKKPKHEDSAEFEAMKKGVSTVVGMFMDSKSTSADVMTTALINMREQARRYYDKKQEGIHLIPSNMRFVRLNMSQRIQKFANDMLGMMADLKNVSETMQKSIDDFVKSSNGRQIVEGESALEHFARCCKEAQKKPENKQLEKIENKEQVCLV